VKGFSRSAQSASLVASGAIALVGAVAGAVRLLPWLLDPSVPWAVAAPFARGLAAVALEAALFLGWPVGCALASFRLVESGEARVLQTLGERPARTLARLAPQALTLALALGAVALVYGSDASAPGRVATELVARARSSCEAVSAPTTYAIPFTEMTWLCSPGTEPRLVGSAPGTMSSAIITAKDARIAGDFRVLELDDARVLFPGAPTIAMHVTTLSMHGMPPWAHASTLPAPLRGLLFALSAWLASWLAAYAVLRGATSTRLDALMLGAVGPLAALGLVRLLERADASPPAFALVPGACAFAVVLAAMLLSRLRLTGRAASSSMRFVGHG
jgi:hypothetical protein